MSARLAALLLGAPLLLGGRHERAHVYVVRTPTTERRYVGTREDGMHVGWYENGAVRFRYTYQEGLMEGAAREWMPDGTLFREAHYRRGQEEGLQRMWWPDGTLRASYVVRNGRRFGLLGAKGCVATDTTS